jgi:hypothetical protein
MTNAIKRRARALTRVQEVLFVATALVVGGVLPDPSHRSILKYQSYPPLVPMQDCHNTHFLLGKDDTDGQLDTPCFRRVGSQF